ILVGYSLGGVIAQMTWHRHRDRVAGLVLCSTSRNFGGSRQEAIFFKALMGAIVAAKLVPRSRGRADALPRALDPALRPLVAEASAVGRRFPAWAWDEMRRTNPVAALGAVAAVGRFSSHEWIGGVDVPTAVVVTTRDHFISPVRQRKLAAARPGAT